MVKKQRRSDAVVHPTHYNMYEGLEVIDLIEQMNFNKGNAVKYITRAEFKGKEIEDLEKARYYLKKEIKRIKRAEKKEAKVKAAVEAAKAMESYLAADANTSAQLYDVASLYPSLVDMPNPKSRFLADGEDIFALQWRPGTPRLREFGEWVNRVDMNNHVTTDGDVLHVHIPSQDVHPILVRPSDWLVFADGRFKVQICQPHNPAGIRRVIRPDMARRWLEPSNESAKSISSWIKEHNHMAWASREGQSLSVVVPIKNAVPERYILQKGDWVVHDHDGFHVLTNDEFNEMYEVM